MSPSILKREPSSPRRARDRGLRGDGGQSLAEFALVLPMIIVVLLAVIELGNAFTVQHAITTISREGANIAARGTTLDTVLQVVMTNGSDLALASRGGSIASQVTIQSGQPLITQQLATLGYSGQSQIGGLGQIATGLTGLGLTEGSDHYVVEVFFGYQAITPLANFLSGVIPSLMYQQAVF